MDLLLLGNIPGPKSKLGSKWNANLLLPSGLIECPPGVPFLDVTAKILEGDGFQLFDAVLDQHDPVRCGIFRIKMLHQDRYGSPGSRANPLQAVSGIANVLAVWSMLIKAGTAGLASGPMVPRVMAAPIYIRKSTSNKFCQHFHPRGVMVVAELI